MSFKVELFNGHWYDEGYVFETRQEATDYRDHLAVIPSRVVPATQPSQFTPGEHVNEAVNYRFKDGKLSRYKAPEKPPMTWEQFVLAGGASGMPYTQIANMRTEALEASMRQVYREVMERAIARAFNWGSIAN